MGTEIELAKSFMEAPSEATLEKLIELIKNNPAAGITIVGILGVAYITKLGLGAVKD